MAVAVGLSFGAVTQDDAFISFRYAENLVQGHGLVFNIGEWVEGYTNLLWTLMMAGLMALGGEPVIGSTMLGLAALAGPILASWPRRQP
jgi:arabinofuranosyltransferase